MPRKGATPPPLDTGHRPRTGDLVLGADGTDDATTRVRFVARQTDQPEVWTVATEQRSIDWVRYDAVRQAWVRARGQADGAPIPPPDDGDAPSTTAASRHRAANRRAAPALVMPDSLAETLP